MREAAGKLAKGRAFSRIDFYQVDNEIYFGEITFYPTSGMGGFAPEEWDLKMGQLISLPGTVWGGKDVIRRKRFDGL